MMTFSSRVVSLSLVVASIVAAAGSPAARASQNPPSNGASRTPVLVELFTSEGCSSCPPADEILARLVGEQPIPGAEIIALGFHVDYWNELGWVDRFSSRAYTTRQNEYAAVWKTDQIYTPQMVVDGLTQFTGNDPRAAAAAITAAVSQPKAQVSLAADAPGDGNGRTSLRIEVKPFEAAKAKADVWLAVTEDGLVSDVKRGENAKRQLSHVAVVRSFERVASADPRQGIAATKTIALDRAWRRDALKAVVIVQDGRSRRILGAASLRLS
jgi:hypothetical protein